MPVSEFFYWRVECETREEISENDAHSSKSMITRAKENFKQIVDTDNDIIAKTFYAILPIHIIFISESIIIP